MKAARTASSDSISISFDFRRRECDDVGRLARQIATNLERLRRNGHPRWKLVDLDVPLEGWDQHDCVRKYLGTQAEESSPSASTADRNPVAEAIKEALGD